MLTHSASLNLQNEMQICIRRRARIVYECDKKCVETFCLLLEKDSKDIVNHFLVVVYRKCTDVWHC